MDDICRCVVLFDGARLEIGQCYVHPVVCGYRIDLPHSRFLCFGDYSFYSALAKRTLPWRVCDTVFALWNLRAFMFALPFAHVAAIVKNRISKEQRMRKPHSLLFFFYQKPMLLATL